MNKVIKELRDNKGNFSKRLWKDLVKKYPDLEGKLVVNKWYKYYWDDNPKELRGFLFVTEVNERQVIFDYGINTAEGDMWMGKDWYSSEHIYKQATEEEVKSFLTKEAKKRGFKEGVKFRDVTDDKVYGYGAYDETFTYNPEPQAYGNNHLKCGTGVCFMDGKWAEVIEGEVLPIINGYEGHISDDGDIVYGCAVLKKEWFTDSISRNIKSLELSSGVRIDEDQVEQIREYLNK